MPRPIAGRASRASVQVSAARSLKRTNPVCRSFSELEMQAAGAFLPEERRLPKSLSSVVLQHADLFPANPSFGTSR
jgi:hypothetical protein